MLPRLNDKRPISLRRDRAKEIFAGLNWTYTAPVLAEGLHSITFKVIDGLNLGVTSDAYKIEIDAVVDVTTQITQVIDSAGALIGSLSSGDRTDDAKIEISGTLSQAQTGHVELYDNNIKIATIDVLKTNIWSVNLDPLSNGLNSLTAKFVNTAGVSGLSSTAFDITIAAQDGILTPTQISGIKTVSLSGADQSFDLTQVGSVNIDQINLGAWGGNTLKITSADVSDSGVGLFTSDYSFSLDQDATNASRYHQMLVTGSGVALKNSTVFLADNVAIGVQPWAMTGTATKNSSVYDGYTNFIDHNQLLVQQGLVVI